MSGLYKKEVVVRPTSTVTLQGAIDFTKGWLNDTFQDKADNKDADGNYIDYFFGDIFDARNGNIYRVFSDACAVKYEMDELVFNILITSEFATATSLEATNTAVSDNTVAIENIEPTDLTAVENTLVEHTDRIVALENQEESVEAVVI